MIFFFFFFLLSCLHFPASKGRDSPLIPQSDVETSSAECKHRSNPPVPVDRKRGCVCGCLSLLQKFIQPAKKAKKKQKRKSLQPPPFASWLAAAAQRAATSNQIVACQRHPWFCLQRRLKEGKKEGRRGRKEKEERQRTEKERKKQKAPQSNLDGTKEERRREL